MRTFDLTLHDHHGIVTNRIRAGSPLQAVHATARQIWGRSKVAQGYTLDSSTLVVKGIGSFSYDVREVR